MPSNRRSLWSYVLRFFGAFIAAVIVLRLLTVEIGLAELLAIGTTLVVAEMVRSAVVRHRLARKAARPQGHEASPL